MQLGDAAKIEKFRFALSGFTKKDILYVAQTDSFRSDDCIYDLKMSEDGITYKLNGSDGSTFKFEYDPLSGRFIHKAVPLSDIAKRLELDATAIAGEKFEKKEGKALNEDDRLELCRYMGERSSKNFYHCKNAAKCGITIENEGQKYCNAHLAFARRNTQNINC